MHFLSLKMRLCHYFFKLTIFFIFISKMAFSQAVPVKEEPLHKPVFSNEYLRLLDVWLKPGDTSLFHIHEIPSVFCYLSTGRYLAKVEGEPGWTIVNAAAGQSWYRSFEEGRLVHQVANPFDTALHVTDIELLGVWKKKALAPLPFNQLFSADRIYAYQLYKNHLPDTMISGRGPIMLEMVSGEVIFRSGKKKKSLLLKSGQYKFIEAGTSFSFQPVHGSDLVMNLFEIR